MARTKQAIDKEKKAKNVQTGNSELLTVNEVARELRVDDTTVRRWIKTGALDAVALPHSGTRHGYRIRKETLDTLFNTTTRN